jgi:hypothetical protein
MALFNKMPKPPKIDGKCACGCVIEPDKGACPTWQKGAGDRCLICDHDIACHRRKGDPMPEDWNGKPNEARKLIS